MVKAMGHQVAPYTILSYSGSDPALRPYLSLIYASFLKSLRYGNDWFQAIDKDAYFAAYHQFIERLLSSQTSQVRLAVLPDDTDTCIGWSISDGNVLHYVFVKGDIDARKHGIGTALLPKKFDTITHLTHISKSIWERKYPQVKFNPFF